MAVPTSTLGSLSVPGMRSVIVASTNKVKVDAVKLAIKTCFPTMHFHVQGIASASGVPDQPLGDDQTLLGACNRLKYLRVQKTIEADDSRQHATLLVAIEGGVGLRAHDKKMECFAWVALGSDSSDATSTARSASFVLPPAVQKLVTEGMELGAADDMVFNRKMSGKGSGTVGRLTNGNITRTAYYEHAVMMALIPFLNQELYDGFEW